jgi:cytochrome c553
MSKWIIVKALMLCCAVSAVADDMPAKAQACIACHGKVGVSSNPEWPNLAGQHAQYLALQLKAFRDGSRDNPAMVPFVAGLTDADIAVLAKFYSGQKRVAVASGDLGLVAAGEHLSGYCKACHGMSGKPVANEWPIIAGQQAPYLQKQLAAYKSGARINPLMQTAIAHLGDAEFAALAEYYSQLPQ